MAIRRLTLLLLAVAAGAGPSVPDPVDARRQRRERLAETLGRDYALVLGQPLTDVLQPRQEGHFLYLTGVEEPDASLLLAGAKAKPLALPAKRGKTKVREVLFLRDANPRFAQFYGLRFLPGAETARRLGVAATRAAPRGGAGLAGLVAKILPRRARLHVPAYNGPDAAPVREIRKAFGASLKEARPDVRVLDLHPRLARMRVVKDPFEVDALSRAVAATLEAFRGAVPEIRPGGSEAAVDGALIMGVRRQGAWPAYRFVVAAGANGAIPHYFSNRHPLKAGDLLVIDAGAAVDRYAADVTRTFPVSGTFTARQREVYDVVLAAQRAGIDAVRPGSTFGKVDAAARAVIRKAGLGKYFIHPTCHHVGLDVHDPGPQEIVSGMTFTVEPGVYLQDEGFGIRIEDVVLVTETGCKVLSAGFPKDAADIEKLLAR